MWIALILAVTVPSNGNESDRLSASDQAAFDLFGGAVAVDGDTVVVGATNDNNAGGSDAGAAYVYERDGTTWTEIAKLIALDGFTFDLFGTAVAVSGDTVVVGAPLADPGAGLTSAGAAYVFERDQGGPDAWGQLAKLIASDAAADDRFGAAVAISGDTIVAGAYSNDHAGGADAGAAYVYERDQGGPDAWGEVLKLTAADAAPQDSFGIHVALDANTALIGATGADPGGVSLAGAAYVFERDLGGAQAWGQAASFVASDAQPSALFGVVALFGDTAVVGAPNHDHLAGFNAGAAYVFERDQGGPGAWGEVRRLVASDGFGNDLFGGSAAIFGDRIVVGAWLHDQGGRPNAGAAYLFERNRGSAWGETLKLVASDYAVSDYFGVSAAIGADAAFIGAEQDDEGTIVGGVVGGVEDLAFDPVSSTLYGTDVSTELLLTIDTATGAATDAGDLGFIEVRGLAFDPGTGTLYGSDTWTDVLVTIDTSTGAATAVGPFGFASGENVRGLAFDSGSGTLYGARRSLAGGSTVLVTIDTTTGAATAVGAMGFTQVRGLSFDPGAGVLLGVDDATDQLLTIDPSTGAGTVVGALAFAGVRGLALDPGSATLYGNDRDGEDLITIDPGSGVAALVGPLSVGIPDTGSVYVFELSAAVAYCTAGTSAAGCRALLSASGTPSASASSGFDLIAAGVEGARDGLFFFGTGGRQANAWGNGSSYQCVVPPVARGGLLGSVGTSGACDGSFVQDLNARWTAKPAQNPGAGALVQGQLWYRDPFNTSNRTTSLSNAVEFAVSP